MGWRTQARLVQGFFLLCAIGGAVPLIRSGEPWQWFCLYFVASGMWNAGWIEHRIESEDPDDQEPGA